MISREDAIKYLKDNCIEDAESVLEELTGDSLPEKVPTELILSYVSLSSQSICSNYHGINQVIIEEIKDYLGVKPEILINDLAKKTQIPKENIEWRVNYILNNKDSIFQFDKDGDIYFEEEDLKLIL